MMWHPPLTRLSRCVVLSMMLVSLSFAAQAQEEQEPMIVQIMFGEMNIDNEADQITGGNFDIFLFGAAVQKPYGGTMLKYGLETGGLFSWESDVRSFFISSGGGGSTAKVSLDINSFLFDYFFGGYASFEPAGWVRLYLGSGPLIIYGIRDSESINPLTDEKETVNDSGFGYGGYARAGLDFIVTDKMIFSLGGRVTGTSLSLEDTAGEVDIEGWQYFGGFSFRF